MTPPRMAGQDSAPLTRRSTLRLAGALVVVGLAGCGSEDDPATTTPTSSNKITMGFSQVGTESGWRTANSKSIQTAAAAAGVVLDFSNGEQQQQKQIAAMRDFVAKKLDVIAFSPVVESGWDSVLQAAKDARIPVILTDRSIDTTDTSLFKSFLGSDFVAEGRKAGEWLVREYRSEKGPVNIAELEGTTGSAPANDRRTGFADAIAGESKFKIIAAKDGEFTREKGEQVMAGFLRAHDKIDVIFAHNDEMALGAITALEDTGKKPGVDIRIVSVDAVRNGMTALAAGKINFIVECNPLLGPQLMELAKGIIAGQSVPARVVTKETTFTTEQAKAVLPTREY